MKYRLERNKREKYVWSFLALLGIEICIASFIQDDFIRPYLGDYLVVILLYSFLMAVSNLRVIPALLLVLLFSFGIEFLQLLEITHIFGARLPGPVRIVLGSSFSLPDLLAYCLGAISCFLLEALQNYRSVVSTKS